MNDLAQLFRTLADGSRLRILHLLLHTGELCVCDIEAVLGFTQTKVSRHMNYLTRAGLTKDRKVGRWVLYRIAEPRSIQHRVVLDAARAILSSRPEARRDIVVFEKRVKAQCCATFCQVKPSIQQPQRH